MTSWQLTRTVCRTIERSEGKKKKIHTSVSMYSKETMMMMFMTVAIQLPFCGPSRRVSYSFVPCFFTRKKGSSVLSVCMSGSTLKKKSSFIYSYILDLPIGSSCPHEERGIGFYKDKLISPMDLSEYEMREYIYIRGVSFLFFFIYSSKWGEDFSKSGSQGLECCIDK